jgi:hypothetical protein
VEKRDYRLDIERDELIGKSYITLQHLVIKDTALRLDAAPGNRKANAFAPAARAFTSRYTANRKKCSSSD